MKNIDLITLAYIFSGNLLKYCADYSIQLLQYLIKKLTDSNLSVSVLKSMMSLLMYIQFKTKVIEDSGSVSGDNSNHIIQMIDECLKQWIVRPTVIGGSFFGCDTRLSKVKPELKVIIKLN